MTESNPNTAAGLYEILGVKVDADAAAIKRAYRRKAQKLHPDKGGNADAFAAVQLAYEVLSDDDRRKRYDETGAIDDIEKARAAQVDESIRMMVVAMLNSGADLESRDLVKAMCEQIRRNISEHERELKEIERNIDKRLKAATRATRKGDGRNLIAEAILADAKQLSKRAFEIGDQIELGLRIIRALGDYEYKTDLRGARSELWSNFDPANLKRLKFSEKSL
jgi:curved DNA-binding protein CbpA